MVLTVQMTQEQGVAQFIHAMAGIMLGTTKVMREADPHSVIDLIGGILNIAVAMSEAEEDPERKIRYDAAIEDLTRTLAMEVDKYNRDHPKGDRS